MCCPLLIRDADCYHELFAPILPISSSQYVQFQQIPHMLTQSVYSCTGTCVVHTYTYTRGVTCARVLLILIGTEHMQCQSYSFILERCAQALRSQTTTPEIYIANEQSTAIRCGIDVPALEHATSMYLVDVPCIVRVAGRTGAAVQQRYVPVIQRQCRRSRPPACDSNVPPTKYYTPVQRYVLQPIPSS